MLKKFLLPGIVLIGAGILIFVLLVLITTPIGPGVSDYEYKIAGVCSLNRNSAHVINIVCDGIEGKIDAEVYQVGWNDSYLVAATHPLTKTPPNSPNCKDCYPDEDTTYWWIDDLTNKQAYGPMTEQEFTDERNKLRLPDIQLMSVDEAKTKGVWLYGDGRS